MNLCNICICMYLFRRSVRPFIFISSARPSVMSVAWSASESSGCSWIIVFFPRIFRILPLLPRQPLGEWLYIPMALRTLRGEWLYIPMALRTLRSARYVGEGWVGEDWKKRNTLLNTLYTLALTYPSSSKELEHISTSKIENRLHLSTGRKKWVVGYP